MLDRIRAYLLMRVGPLPVWAWLLVTVVLVGGFLWWRKRKGGSGDLSSKLTSPGLSPSLGDPPFVTDPQYGGGRQEPGYQGPNSPVPGWQTPITPLPGSPGSSFDPPLSQIPPITVPQLPTFEAIPPLTPSGKTVTRIPADQRTTSAATQAKMDLVIERFPAVQKAKEAAKQTVGTTAKKASTKTVTPVSKATAPKTATKTVTKVTKSPTSKTSSKSYGRLA